jgi:hypothetical protein
MGNLRKIVGVSLAVAVALGLVAYVLVPHAGPTNESIVVNQPQTPTTPGGSTDTGTGGSGGTTSPPPTSDHVRLPKLHGKNSEGPKHVVCLPANPHVQGTAQYQGANWYRGQCMQAAGASSQGHGHAYGHSNSDVAAAYSVLHARMAQER